MNNGAIIWATVAGMLAVISVVIVICADMIDHKLNPLDNYVSDIAIGVWRPAMHIVFTSITIAAFVSAALILQLNHKDFKTELPAYLMILSGFCIFQLNIFVADPDTPDAVSTLQGRTHTFFTQAGFTAAIVSVIAVTLQTISGVWTLWIGQSDIFVPADVVGCLVGLLVITGISAVGELFLSKISSEAVGPRPADGPMRLHRLDGLSGQRNPVDPMSPSYTGTLPIGLTERGMMFSVLAWLYIYNQSILIFLVHGHV